MLKVYELSNEAKQVAFKEWRETGNDPFFMQSFSNDVLNVAKQWNVEIKEVIVTLDHVSLVFAGTWSPYRDEVVKTFLALVKELNDIFTFENFLNECEYNDFSFTNEGRFIFESEVV